VSAQQSRLTAVDRDQVIEQAANTRGDRLVTAGREPRQVAWIAALRMAADYPLVGLGPGTWPRESTMFSNDPLVATFYQHRQFAHNDLFQVAAEWGGISLVAWIAIWVGALLRAASTAAETGFGEGGVLVAIFAFALFSFFHFPLQLPALYLWAMLLVGLGWAKLRRRNRRSPPEPAAGKSKPQAV
jgi:O-antigen ligase